MNRRTLLKSLLVLPLTGTILLAKKQDLTNNQEFNSFQKLGSLSYNDCTQKKFNELIKTSERELWGHLSINELIGKLSYSLIGVPYTSGTLDCDSEEIVKLNLCGVDCVTYFETMLCLARILKKGKNKIEGLLDEIRFTRYRNGVLSDYTSRLHYTADWIYDNVKKHVVDDISKDLGGEKIKFDVNFMSKNPNFYYALKRDSSLVKKIAEQETSISSRLYYLIPKEKIHLSEPAIKTGDIIAIGTNKSGLDYGHTGFAYRDNENSLHFLHASLKKKMVTLDTNISSFVKANQTFTGISVLRPYSTVN